MRIPRHFLLSALLLLPLAARPASPDLYPDPAQAKIDLAAALKSAAKEHKRVLLDFGGNWCGDCKVLDIYLHNPQNRALLEANFELVHINVGHFDENVDIAQRYGIPLEKGVPAVAVLSPTGKLLYSQKAGEFESMRRLDASAVTKFLVQWKPARQGCSVMVVNC